jgi:hypothetical protein
MSPCVVFSLPLLLLVFLPSATPQNFNAPSAWTTTSASRHHCSKHNAITSHSSPRIPSTDYHSPRPLFPLTCPSDRRYSCSLVSLRPTQRRPRLTPPPASPHPPRSPQVRHGVVCKQRRHSWRENERGAAANFGCDRFQLQRQHLHRNAVRFPLAASVQADGPCARLIRLLALSFAVVVALMRHAIKLISGILAHRARERRLRWSVHPPPCFAFADAVC